MHITLSILQYLAIDNPCISYKYKYFEKTEAALNKEFPSIYYGFCRKYIFNSQSTLFIKQNAFCFF